MAVSLTLSGLNASVTNVKTNTDTDDDGEKDIRAHIDFRCEIDAELMNQLSFGDIFDFSKVFFTDKGDVVNVGIKKMEIDRKFEDHRVTIQHDKLSNAPKVWFEADIHKLVLMPIQGRKFVMLFRVATNPGIDKTKFIHESQIVDCIVSVEPIQRDLEDGETSGD